MPQNDLKQKLNKTGAHLGLDVCMMHVEMMQPFAGHGLS